MKIFLVRHGRALSRHDDPCRALHQQGLAEIQAGADFLRDYEQRVQMVICSRRLRARQTGEIMAQRLGVAISDMIYSSHLDPGASAANALDYLSTLPCTESMLIAGHRPNLAELASLLLAGHSELRLNFGTGTIYALETDVIAAYRAELRFAVPAELSRQLAAHRSSV